jgi:hypothetical protein
MLLLVVMARGQLMPRASQNAEAQKCRHRSIDKARLAGATAAKFTCCRGQAGTKFQYKLKLGEWRAPEGGLWVDAFPPAISTPAGRQPVPGVKPAWHAHAATWIESSFTCNGRPCDDV